MELAGQEGEETLRRALWDRTLRVHSISEQEMVSYPRERVLNRFLRAVRERNIRVCYVHLFLRPQDDLLAYNVGFLQDLSAGLEASGYTVGQTEPLPPFVPPSWAVLLMQIGIGAGAVLLAGRLLPLGNRGRAGLFVLVLVAALAAYLKGGDGGQTVSLWALLAGLTFPVLGLVLAWHKLELETPHARALGRSWPLVRAVGLTVEVALFSLMGGLFIAALLARTPYLVGAEQFRGVKLVLLWPPFLLFVAMVCGLKRPYINFDAWKSQISASLRRFASQPLLAGEALVILFALGVVGVLVIRSGNAAAGAAPMLELKARAFLEETLWARPRTKEFLTVSYTHLTLPTKRIV